MTTDAPRREPLTKVVVLRTAVELADEVGDVPSTRQLADRIGVKAMALYHHFRNKDALLDGMVDLVFAEIDLPAADVDWQTAMRRRCISMREALMRHRWAIGLMDSRANPGYETLRHHDAVLGCLRAGGFTVAGAAHAFSVVDGYVYGFVLQELALPFQAPEEVEDVADVIMRDLPPEFPHLAEMITEHALQPGYSHADEFGIGLDLVLDGLRHHREAW